MGIKMPRVRIEFEEDESYAIGKISIGFVLGFALRLFWPFLTILGAYTFSNQIAVQYADELNLASVGAFACTMLAYGIFLKQLRMLFSTPKKRDANRFFAAVIMVLGVLLIIVANAFPVIALPVLIIAGILTGTGSAMLMMSYGVSASICDAATVALSAALSFFIAMLLFAAVACTCQNQPILCCILAAACPFIEWFCLHESSKSLIDRLRFLNITVPVRLPLIGIHFILPCFMLGVALAICRLLMMDLSLGGNFYMASSVVQGAVVAFVCIAFAVLTQRHISRFMWRVLTPFIAAGLLILTIVDLQSTPYDALLFTAFYILIACSVWVSLADISQRYRISAFTVFGFGYGGLLLGETLAFAVEAYIKDLANVFIDSPHVTALLFFLIVTGLVLLPRDSEVRKTLVKDYPFPAVTSKEIEEELLLDANEAEQSSTEDEQTQNTQAPKDTTAANQSKDEGPAEEERAAAAHDNDESSPYGKLGRYKRKCAVVADTYLLSRKEAEVLFLLAKGRNAAAIQEALYIAPGTANTHMRHIYRKLDVHSQQELIELVESIELNDAQD